MAICRVLCNDTASRVRSNPYITHGWRPISVVTHPATGQSDRRAPYRAQTTGRDASGTAAADSAAALQIPKAIINTPIPTMMRNDQKTAGE